VRDHLGHPMSLGADSPDAMGRHARHPWPVNGCRLLNAGARHQNRVLNQAPLLQEIQRPAAVSGNTALGSRQVTVATGIQEADWLGQFWARWREALREARDVSGVSRSVPWDCGDRAG